MNLYDRLAPVFGDAGAAPALICPPEAPGSLSYADLLALVDKAAGALAGAGVGAGDRVLVQVDKTPAAVALYLGCLKAGAVYAPINTAYTAPEVAYFLDDAEPALFVAGDADRVPPDCRAAVEFLDADGGGSWADRVADARPLSQTVARATDDLAALVYTSGTTGRSKGAMLTHGNLLSNAETLCRYWGWRNDDVLLHALPIFHVHGLFVALHCAFLAGTPVIFLPSFNADALIRELPRSTVLMGVPTFYTRLLAREDFDARVCRGMRLFISGSAPLTEQTFAAFEERTDMRILERYGMSETLMNTSNPLDGQRVAGTVGFSLPGVETRIADESGMPLGTGEVGGIEVRGSNVFKGYWRMPEKTAEEFRDDGYFITGDLGTMDDEGRVTIVGRAKDLVISGGYNVYPKEVEALLDEMPGVVESAVIGVPHEDFGEGVVAVLVPEGDAVSLADMDAFLAGRLARYKQPKAVVCTDALPRNAMGKVQKNALRDAYGEILTPSG